MTPLTFFAAWLLFGTAFLPHQDQEQVQQDTSAAPPTILDFEAISQQVAASVQSSDAAPAPPPLLTNNLVATIAEDSLTQAKQLAALQAYFDYRMHGYDHRQRVFEWQLLSARIIFVIVILLVLAGVYFSGVQFHIGLKERRAEAISSSASSEEEPVTEFEASMQGIKISSSTLGVIILVISLAFFYLYLVFVYPVEEIL